VDKVNIYKTNAKYLVLMSMMHMMGVDVIECFLKLMIFTDDYMNYHDDLINLFIC
jgi:hypothetical protein